MNQLHEIAVKTGEQTPDRLQPVVRILSVVSLLFGLATLLGSIYIAVRAYTPVWFFDEWSVPIDYKALGGHYPLWKFWAQHNEHRIPFMKGLQLVDLFWFKGDRRPLLVLTWMVQGCLWSVLTFFLSRLRRFSRAELATLAGIAAFVVFNPNQLQNFEWFFQAGFLAASLFGCLRSPPSVSTRMISRLIAAQRWL